MSVEAMSWALRQQAVTDPTARHVLLVLANYADVDGQAAMPSVKTLARLTGLSPRAVMKKLDAMKAIGAIRQGNQDHAKTKIDRPDKRPVVYDLAMEPETERGEPRAHRSPSGVNHVHTATTERGEPRADEEALEQEQQLLDQKLAERAKKRAPQPAKIDPADILDELPLADGSGFPLTKQHAETFLRAYPGVDIPAEFRKMRAWSIANPKLRKTARGALRFVNSWIERAQNRLGAINVRPGQSAGATISALDALDRERSHPRGMAGG